MPAMTVPKSAVLIALSLLAACGEKYRPVSLGDVVTEAPEKRARSRLDDAANGHLEAGDVSLSWDLDPRPLEGATNATVNGHPAIQIGNELVWHCDKTQRTFHLSAPRKLATNCHPQPMQKLGEVPVASSAILGPGWRLGNRNPTSISWLSDEAVLTFFSAQQIDGPRTGHEAECWAVAAGLQNVHAINSQEATGPQGHPAQEVSGTATLNGREMKWTLLFWRCRQRQRSFAAIVFSEKGGEEQMLRAPRCHG
jgi:hypothetical protein